MKNHFPSVDSNIIEDSSIEKFVKKKEESKNVKIRSVNDTITTARLSNSDLD